MNDYLKKIFLSALLIFFIISISYANNIKKKDVEYISKYINTWGLLKYFHNSYKENCLINYDSIFIQSINRIIYKKTSFESEIWNLFKLNSNKLFSELLKKDFNVHNYNSLIEEIQLIEGSKNIYVTYGVANQVKINNDTSFASLEYSFPEIEIRLLTLARIWIIVKYFYPYINNSNYNWNKLLNKFIYECQFISNKSEYNLWLFTIMKYMEDGHGSITWSKELADDLGHFSYLPYTYNIVGNKIYIDKYVGKDPLNDNLHHGERVLKINGIKAKRVLKEYLQYSYSGSNITAKKLFVVNTFIFRGKTDSVKLVTSKNGNRRIINIKRYKSQNDYYSYNKKEPLFCIKEGIYILNMGDLENKDLDSIFRIVNNNAYL